MADRIEIEPELRNAKITVPEKTTDSLGASHWYVDTDHASTTISVTLKADEGYTFESDGTFVYQGAYNELTSPIKASKTDTVTFTLPKLDWNDQYTPFTLTMSATKKSAPEKPTPTHTPTTITPSTAPTTQLDVLKNSLRIPLDLTEDNTLLQSYIDAATEYLKSTLDEENMTRLDSKRAKVIINALAELMYQSRGDDTVTKDFPFTLRALINQLKY